MNLIGLKVPQEGSKVLKNKSISLDSLDSPLAVSLSYSRLTMCNGSINTVSINVGLGKI